MQAIATTQDAGALAGQHLAQRKIGDRAFRWFTLLMALSVFVLIVLIGLKLASGSQLALSKFGWHFLTGTKWDPVHENFGALPQIYGTLVSSLIAIVIAVPLSIATAVFLTELAPLWMRQPLTIFIELLAAVPSVILGLWGMYVLVPWLHDHFYPALKGTFGYLAIFSGPISGNCMLSAGVILAIMIVPIITSVSREILRSVPGLQREAAYALGATRWEVTRLAVLSYAKRGLFGAVILGLGRALGETMAVLMVIGNTPQIKASFLAPGTTLAGWSALQFTEADGALYLSSLFELGLVLLGVTVLVNALAQLMLKTFAGPGVKPQH
jgi:phosphate transport system permease protein